MSHHIRTRRDVEQLADNPCVESPCCGRRTSADMLVDARALPLEVRPRGAIEICDACLDRAIREGRLSEEALHAAHGAPPAVLDRARLRDADARARREGPMRGLA